MKPDNGDDMIEILLALALGFGGIGWDVNELDPDTGLREDAKVTDTAAKPGDLFGWWEARTPVRDRVSPPPAASFCWGGRSRCR